MQQFSLLLCLCLIPQSRSVRAAQLWIKAAAPSFIQHSHYCFINVLPPCVSTEVRQAQHIFNKLPLCLIIKTHKHQQLSIVSGVSGLIHS